MDLPASPRRKLKLHLCLAKIETAAGFMQFIKIAKRNNLWLTRNCGGKKAIRRRLAESLSFIYSASPLLLGVKGRALQTRFGNCRSATCSTSGAVQERALSSGKVR